MRKLKKLFALLLFLFPAVLRAQVTYTASSYAGTTGSTCASTCTLALGTNAVSGGIIVVSMAWQASATTVSSLTGTTGSCTLLAATAWTDSGGNHAGEDGYCLPTASAAYTVTAHMSTGTFQFEIQAAAYTGQSISTPIDISAASSVACSGTSCSAPNVTTTVANDLVVSTAIEVSGNGASFTAGSGSLRGAVAGFLGYQDQSQATAGSVTPNFTTSAGAGTTGMSTIAIEPATAANVDSGDPFVISQNPAGKRSALSARRDKCRNLMLELKA